MYPQHKHIFGALVTIFVVVVVSIFGAVLFIKLTDVEHAANFQLAKQTIIFGFIVFILILSGTYAALEYIKQHYDHKRIEKEREAELFFGKSELLRFIHNELKRYDGNESFFFANDRNMIMLLSEIKDLYRIAKLQHQRKSRTAPLGIDPQLNIEIERFVEEQKARLQALNKEKVSNGNGGNGKK